MSGTNYANWTIGKLKQRLRPFNATLSGRKEDLIKRLEYYMSQRSSIAASPSPPHSNPIPNWPDAQHFRSLCSEHLSAIPPVHKAALENYVLLHRHDESGDIEAIMRGETMLEHCMAALSSHTSNNITFFTGIVRAENKVSYSIRFVSDSFGLLTHSSCECPVGQGPFATCKHVCAAILAAICFKETGYMKNKYSRTLQKINKAKNMYKGSPMEAHKFANELGAFDDDPRQEIYKNNKDWYNSFVKSQIVSFSLTSGLDISMRYAYRKGDMQAAAEDHFYERKK